MQYILETINLKKNYGKFNILKDLNMHITKGAIYGFIGKNGAGKTTLIRIICGLQKPTSGSYSIYGILNNNKKIIESRKKIGAIIESPSICLDMSAKDNLILQNKIIGVHNDKNVDDILKLIGLENTGTKKAKNFSLGMRQRLAIGVALVGNPKFLILDEPINGLDPEGIIEIRNLILRLNKENNITFLISSHYLDELSKIATCYGFINEGKIVKEINREDLEKELHQKIRINVDNLQICDNYLNDNKLEYKIISETLVDIYSNFNISKLIIELSKLNCNVNGIQENGESLENYYLSLIGDTKNE